MKYLKVVLFGCAAALAACSGEKDSGKISLTAQTALDSGNVAYRRGDYKAANEFFRQASQADPKNVADASKIMSARVRLTPEAYTALMGGTHFLGKAKREPLLLRVADAVQAGDDVIQGGRVIGSVASVAGTAPRIALAVLPLERGGEPLEVAGAAAASEPFLDGLAR